MTDEPQKRTRLPAWLTWRRVETVLTVAVLVFAVHRLWPQIAAVAGVGGPVGTAPAVVFESPDGEPVALAELEGQVVLVNFWATWCGPCKLEMPGFQRLYEDKRDQGFTILGVSTDRGSWDDVRAFLLERGVDYPVVRTSATADRAFGGINAIPTSFLIDRQGIIRHRIFGFMPPPALRIAVNRLLAE
jgi:thiol-disulfide isomerase/thioredoxin